MSENRSDMAERVRKLRGRAEDITSMASRHPVAARGRFPEPTASDTLEGAVADDLENLTAIVAEAATVIAPFAKSARSFPASIYGTDRVNMRADLAPRLIDLRRAQEWFDKYGHAPGRIEPDYPPNRIAAMEAALCDLLASYDPERGVIDIEPDDGCLECTVGTTPRQSGLCAYHRALALVEKDGKP